MLVGPPECWGGFELHARSLDAGKEHFPSSVSWGQAGKFPFLPDTLLYCKSSSYSASETDKQTNKSEKQI